jgi:hypothetical protein
MPKSISEGNRKVPFFVAGSGVADHPTIGVLKYAVVPTRLRLIPPRANQGWRQVNVQIDL